MSCHDVQSLEDFPKAPPRRAGGFLALLDVVFASVGVFIVLIVLQAATVRPNDPPGEADLYAVLSANGTVLSAISQTRKWKDIGVETAQTERPIKLWIEHITELSVQAQGIITIEISHDAEAIPNRFELERTLNLTVQKGAGEGKSPAFTVVWRPLSSLDDPQTYAASRAQNQPLGEPSQ